MRAKKRNAKEMATKSVIGTSYKVGEKTLTMRVSADEGAHATSWLKGRGRPIWSDLLREAHAHARKALGREPYAVEVREVAMVMMREPTAVKRLAMLMKAMPGTKRERAAKPKAKKHVEANA